MRYNTPRHVRTIQQRARAPDNYTEIMRESNPWRNVHFLWNEDKENPRLFHKTTSHLALKRLRISKATPVTLSHRANLLNQNKPSLNPTSRRYTTHIQYIPTDQLAMRATPQPSGCL